MTERQKETYNRMLLALKKIANGYMTVSQIRKYSGDEYGLDFIDTVEMAYENVQAEAKAASKGIRPII